MRVLAAALAVLLSGCMADTELVRVSVNAPNAAVSGGGTSCIGAGGVLELKRGRDVVVTAAAPGYLSQSRTLRSNTNPGRVVASVFQKIILAPFTIGLSLIVGLPMNFSSGALCTLSPDEVEFDLAKDPDAESGHGRVVIVAPAPAAPPTAAPQPSVEQPAAAPVSPAAAPVSPAASAPAARRRFCSSCGAELPNPDAKFCPGCGARQ